MNLVNKQYVVWLQIGQQASQVTGFIENRAGSHLNIGIQFIGDNM
jgi:hypothetical protein